MKLIAIITSGLAASATAATCNSTLCPDCHDLSATCFNWMALILSGATLASIVGIIFLKPHWKGWFTTILLCFGLATVGFSADKKEPISEAKPAKVTIGEILAKPDAYEGKDVTVKAKIAGVCTSDGCLTLKDKFDVIEGTPPDGGFKKQPAVGSQLEVTGTVKVKDSGKEKQVSIAVKKVEVIEK